MKGQINIVEMIFVLIILLVAFGIFFPRFFYESKWNDAYLLLTSRDLMLTMDRINKLYDYSFDKDSMSLFIDKVIPTNKTNLVAWSEVEGTIQNRVIVACDCTKEQIDEMNFWFSGLKINGRGVNVLLVQTNLSSIPEETDVLLIRDYKVLSQYITNFQSYVAKGVGMVEMMDFPTRTDEVNNDMVQRQIFGLKWVNGEKGVPDYMIFARKPANSNDITYAPYKYFYHVPLPLKGNSTESVSGCSYQPSAKGNLLLGQTGYAFWVCSDNSAWFDTNADGNRDSLGSLGQRIIIGGYNFTLNYVNDNEGIGLSFKPVYVFSEFLSYTLPAGQPEPGGWAWGTKGVTDIEPVDDNTQRILIKAVKQQKEYPAVILNQTPIARTAWIANFDREGKASDEQKTLLLSLLLWASKKRVAAPVYLVKSGYSSSYVNVKNEDMFEIYKFNLILAYPY